MTSTPLSVHCERQAVHPKQRSLFLTVHSPRSFSSNTLTMHTEAQSPLPLQAFTMTLKDPRRQSVTKHLTERPLRRFCDDNILPPRRKNAKRRVPVLLTSPVPGDSWQLTLRSLQGMCPTPWSKSGRAPCVSLFSVGYSSKVGPHPFSTLRSKTRPSSLGSLPRSCQ